MQPPQTERKPSPLEEADRRALLKRRLATDSTDPFATDPHPEVNTLGRLALRLPNDVDYLFALGDLCAQLSVSAEGRLSIFYVGKVLIAYQRAYAAARHDVDRGMARSALDSYAHWACQVLEKYPSVRNAATILWLVARKRRRSQAAHAAHQLYRPHARPANLSGSLTR